MSVRVAVLVFPGTNSEDETLRALQAVGVDAALVHWSAPEALARFDAFVLPGGFAYEDRIRAGAVSAHDALMEPVIAAAQRGKFVLAPPAGSAVRRSARSMPCVNGIPMSTSGRQKKPRSARITRSIVREREHRAGGERVALQRRDRCHVELEHAREQLVHARHERRDLLLIGAHPLEIEPVREDLAARRRHERARRRRRLHLDRGTPRARRARPALKRFSPSPRLSTKTSPSRCKLGSEGGCSSSGLNALLLSLSLIARAARTRGSCL